MGVGLGQGLVAFLSGVQEGAEKIDEKIAANMKRIQESNPDENLKSKYATEYAKFDEDKKLIASILLKRISVFFNSDFFLFSSLISFKKRILLKKIVLCFLKLNR